MGLEEVINEIISDAENSSKKIINDAKKESEGIIKKAREDAAKIEQESMDAAKRKASQKEKSGIRAQELEGKKLLLDAQRRVLESVYAKAEEMAKNLPLKDKKEIYSGCIKAAKKRIEAKYVHCIPEDKALVEQLAKGMKVFPDLHGTGGLIIEDAHHERMENHTFESIMEKIRERTKGEVYRIVFGGSR